MEWWEYTNEDFITRGNRPSLGSYTDFKLGNTGKKLRITDKGLAAGAVGGALAFGAQKLIKNMRKDKETEKPDMDEARNRGITTLVLSRSWRLTSLNSPMLIFIN
jgi:hypothetical protein